MKTKQLIICLLLSIVTINTYGQTTPSPKLYFIENYNPKNTTGSQYGNYLKVQSYKYKQLVPNPPRWSVVRDSTNLSKVNYLFRMECHRFDSAASTDSKKIPSRSRNETFINVSHGFDSVFSYSWRFICKDNFQRNSTFDVLLMQWFAQGDTIDGVIKSGRPVMNIRFDSLTKNLSFGHLIQGLPESRVYLGVLPMNTWIDLTVELKWHYDPKVGYIKIWMNGVPKVLSTSKRTPYKLFIKNIDTYIDLAGNRINTYPYVKWGLYRQRDYLVPVQVIYFDKFSYRYVGKTPPLPFEIVEE